MTEQVESAQDIEIYVKYVAIEQIELWLRHEFDQVTRIDGDASAPKTARCYQVINKEGLDQEPIEVMIIPKVVGIFSSVWFDATTTPWANDQACASAAFAFIQQEIRCTPGSWHEDQDLDLWWSISEAGEKEMIWAQNK